MCCRYLLLQQHYRAVLERLGIEAPAGFLARFNIAPGSSIPVVRQRPRDGGREAINLQWGLVPGWAKSADGATRLANARAESLADKPSFRDAWHARRCVIPASGYYEWKRSEHRREPWLFQRADERPFCLAGLWESWMPPDGEAFETCTVVTTAPHELMQPVHDRMPVVLSPAQCELWLDPASAPPARFLQPHAAGPWRARRVSKRVNNIRHDDPACLEPPPHGMEDSLHEPELPLGP
jgi:putative SOS response-associated peptidase YedK